MIDSSDFEPSTVPDATGTAARAALRDTVPDGPGSLAEPSDDSADRSRTPADQVSHQRRTSTERTGIHSGSPKTRPSVEAAPAALGRLRTDARYSKSESAPSSAAPPSAAPPSTAPPSTAHPNTATPSTRSLSPASLEAAIEENAPRKRAGAGRSPGRAGSAKLREKDRLTERRDSSVPPTGGASAEDGTVSVLTDSSETVISARASIARTIHTTMQSVARPGPPPSHSWDERRVMRLEREIDQLVARVKLSTKRQGELERQLRVGLLSCAILILALLLQWLL